VPDARNLQEMRDNNKGVPFTPLLPLWDSVWPLTEILNVTIFVVERINAHDNWK
jgi:hypothetical protein